METEITEAADIKPSKEEIEMGISGMGSITNKRGQYQSPSKIVTICLYLPFKYLHLYHFQQENL